MPDRRDNLPERNDDQSDDKRVPSRRTFLQATGAVLGGGAFLAGGAAAADGYDHELTIVSTEEPSETGDLAVTYEFTTTGEITTLTDNGRNSAEDNDAIERNDDGTWTASGLTGNGFGDAFAFNGSVVDFVADGQYEVRLDGNVVTVDELLQSDAIQFSLASLTQDFTEYTIEVAAESAPEPVSTGVEDRLAAESDDTVTALDNGNYLIEGRTGTADGEPPAYGDTFRWVPASDENWGIESFEYTVANADDLRITVDGEAVDPQVLTGVQEVQVSVSSLTEQFTEYTIDVHAESAPEPLSGNADVEERLVAEDSDTVSEADNGRYRIEGRTGTANGEPPAYGDSFRWVPASDELWGVENFEYTVAQPEDLQILVNGQEVDATEFPGGRIEETQETQEESDPVIGGGDGYADTVPQSEADYLVASRSELLDAVDAAGDGDVVYVESGVTIDAGEGDFHVPDGVTLASDRGIDGAPGGEIKFTTHLWPHVTLGSDVRVTGLRICGINTEYHGVTRPRNIGLETQGNGIEIDNCELFGFRGAAVSASADTHVHHCHIHDNPMDGLGYGVRCVGGTPLVEYCRFDANRHSVMSSGRSGYTFRYNVVEDTAWGIPIDIHSPGYGHYEVHNNTVRATTWPSNHAGRDYDGTEPIPAMQIRGEPDSCEIRDNWFYNETPPADPADGYGPEAIVKADPSSWGAVNFDGNHYGQDEPDTSTGHPR